MKNIPKLIAAVVATLVLTGCALQREENPIANRDGSILVFDKTNAKDGMYVMKSNGDMNPLLTAGVNTESETNYVAFSNFDQLIPTLHKGKKNSIAMVSSEASPKTEYTLYKLKDYGYTIGINFGVPADTSEIETDEDVLQGSRVVFGSRVNAYSPIQSYLMQSLATESLDSIWIDTINNEKITPSMVTQLGFIKGLQKKAMYSLGVYKGTKYYKVDVQSDTRLLEETGESYVAEMVKVKKDTYFTMELPEDLEPGYYLIENAGLFKYEGS